MRPFRCALVTVLLVLVLAPACKPGWYTYTTADGLASNMIRSIYEDRSGDLWICTLGYGVSRYDGVSWRTYTTADGLASDYVYAVLGDHSGAFWFSTEAGLSRFDGTGWHTYTRVDQGSGATSILEDASGNLWFGVLGGAVKYDGTNWYQYDVRYGLRGNYVQTIFEDQSGNLWFGADEGGVTRYDGVNWRTYTTADGLAGTSVNRIGQDRSGALWFGTYQGDMDDDVMPSDGVSRFDGVTWQTYTTADGVPDHFVTGMCTDRAGNLWFTTTRGVCQFDGSRLRTFTTADGLPYENAWDVRQDDSGNLWIGTWNGLARFDYAEARTFTVSDGLVSNLVQVISKDKAGRLWFGTRDSGASMYDGAAWHAYTTENGLPDNAVGAIVQDHLGNIWFATDQGASRYDGDHWQTYTVADGLASDYVDAIAEDSSGNLWFGTSFGLTRYDGQSWRTFTENDGLIRRDPDVILVDRSGNVWAGTYEGLNRYDGSSWETYTTANGLGGNFVAAMLEDHDGNIWVGTRLGGLSKYDGSGWRTYTTADGLASNDAVAICEDHLENLWVGSPSGLTRYDGVKWGLCDVNDGFPSSYVYAVLEDDAGNLWLSRPPGEGVTCYAPDRVPPETVISPRPLAITASTSQTITFCAGFGEVKGVTFSYSLDGSSWSTWSRLNFWQGSNLADGLHRFEVKACDAVGNVDPTAAVCNFEIDASPPVPVILTPASGEAVRGSVVIEGRAVDARFRNFWVEVREANSPSWVALGEGDQPVDEGALANWDTAPLPDGNYELRLSVADTLDLVGRALVRVKVDNVPPWADQTAPAIISVTSGGDVYTSDEGVHLYFPPHAFARDTEVQIEPLSEAEVPDSLGTGVHRASVGYQIAWSGAGLQKPATMEMVVPAEEGALAIYLFGADSTWRRLGGTVDASGSPLSSAIAEPGRYGVFSETSVPPGSGGLSGLIVTPRVFSAAGSFATEEAAISFTLGRPGAVTVKIYNRAGRLVRGVASGQQMNAGTNLIRWDGRDSDANIVQDGVYLVVVEALGEKEVKTIALVR